MKIKKGFTLLEMLIVVAIIGVLITIAVPVFNSQLEKTRDATDSANLRSAKAVALISYFTDTAPDGNQIEYDSDGSAEYYFDILSGQLTSSIPTPYGKGLKSPDRTSEVVVINMFSNGEVTVGWTGETMEVALLSTVSFVYTSIQDKNSEVYAYLNNSEKYAYLKKKVSDPDNPTTLDMTRALAYSFYASNDNSYEKVSSEYHSSDSANYDDYVWKPVATDTEGNYIVMATKVTSDVSTKTNGMSSLVYHNGKYYEHHNKNNGSIDKTYITDRGFDVSKLNEENGWVEYNPFSVDNE